MIIQILNPVREESLSILTSKCSRSRKCLSPNDDIEFYCETIHDTRTSKSDPIEDNLAIKFLTSNLGFGNILVENINVYSTIEQTAFILRHYDEIKVRCGLNEIQEYQEKSVA